MKYSKPKLKKSNKKKLPLSANFAPPPPDKSTESDDNKKSEPIVAKKPDSKSRDKQ